jgi:hypothetical protein
MRYAAALAPQRSTRGHKKPSMPMSALRPAAIAIFAALTALPVMRNLACAPGKD